MPTIGSGKNKKEFPYTKKGEAKAKVVAKKTGQKITMSKKGKTALQDMFEMEQKEMKSGKMDKETMKDTKEEMMAIKKKGKK